MEHYVLYFLVLVFLCFNCPESNASEFIVSSMQLQKIILNPCSDPSDCEHLQNATCVNGFCECNGSKFCEDIPAVTKVTKVGGTCHIDADCNIEHSICNEKKCKCNVGRVSSVDQRQCLKVAEGLGSTCEDSIQCYTKVPQSGCRDEKCVCQQNTHEYEGNCFNDVALGQQCTHLGNCSNILFSRCTSDKCTCKEGYVANSVGNKCLEVARKIDDPCYENVQCSTKFGTALCKGGFCKCEQLYQFKKAMGTCVRHMFLEDVCSEHSQCNGDEEEEKRLECILGQCKCKSGFVQDHGFCTSAGNGFGYGPTVLCILPVATLLFFHGNPLLM